MDYLDNVIKKCHAVQRALDDLDRSLELAKDQREDFTEKGVTFINSTSFYLNEMRIFYDEIKQNIVEVESRGQIKKYPEAEAKHITIKNGSNNSLNDFQRKVESVVGKPVEIKNIEYAGMTKGAKGQPRFVSTYDVIYVEKGNAE
jgi:hypothetical protein